MHEFAGSGASLATLADDALLGRQRDLITQRRRVDAELASVAGEIARRSDRALGFKGLAARLGVRTPEQLIAQETGVSVREAGALVRVGTAAGQGGGTGALVGAALEAGSVSIAAADEIVRGIGVPSPSVDSLDLEHAVTGILADTDGRTAESLGEVARDLRVLLNGSV